MMELNPFEREYAWPAWWERWGKTVGELAWTFIAALIIGCLLLLGLSGCGPGQPSPSPSPTATPGPTPTPQPGWDCANPPRIRGVLLWIKGTPGQYTVRLRSRVRASSASVASRYSTLAGVKVRKVHRKGFSAQMSAGVAQRVAEDPDVEFIHESVPMKASVTWGIDRVDQRGSFPDGKYEPGNTAMGINVAVIDTGVDASHSDFQGRIAPKCFDAYGGDCSDDNGHGTHVMGTVLSATWGVAKAATGYRVRVLRNGTGSDADVIEGIEWVTQQKQANPGTDWVANMSLGGDASPALDAATCDSIEAGVVYAVAAGNDFGADACQQSPARVAQAITVGASARGDSVASFSNLGRCLDLFAPGQDIESARRGGGSTTLSGTSMASPHVAGGAALWLQREPGSAPSAVRANLVQFATRDALSGVGSSANALLFVKAQ